MAEYRSIINDTGASGLLRVSPRKRVSAESYVRTEHLSSLQTHGELAYSGSSAT